MKVHGDAKPPQWAADYCPGRPGRAWVRFCLNAQEVTDGDWHGWEYDEYTTEVEHTPGLLDEVAANFDALLLEAKANEKSKAQLVAENEALQKTVSDNDAMNVDQEYRLTLLELGVAE